MLQSQYQDIESEKKERPRKWNWDRIIGHHCFAANSDMCNFYIESTNFDVEQACRKQAPSSGLILQAAVYASKTTTFWHLDSIILAPVYQPPPLRLD